MDITEEMEKQMAGTKAGGIKARESNLRKNPNHYIEVGRKGGQQRSPDKGFGSMDRDKVSKAGRKGGSISRRTGIKNGEGKYEQTIRS